MSTTFNCSPVLWTPSSSITVQNGQATASVVGAGRGGLVHACLVDLAGPFLHPHVRTARAAAEGAAAAARHLDGGAGRGHQLARVGEHVVVAGEVAGVVVGDPPW